MSTEPLRRVLRAALYNPETVPKRMKEMQLHLERQHQEGHDTILGMLDVLEQEIARFDRQQAEKTQRQDGPTRETVRKMREDPVLFLLSRGVIDKDDQLAIEVIRDLRFKITMGLTTGGTDLKGERVDTSRKGFVHPIERLTERQDKVHRHVYKPWAAEHSRDGVTVGKRGRVLSITPFSLVVSVIEDGIPLMVLEEQQKVRNGSLSKPFTAAVRKFAAALSKAEQEGKVPRGAK